jgi:hypothetical protein
MFKYTRVELNRSETTSITVDIPPWEVAVMAAVNGDDRVKVIGETPVRRELPDPAYEYDRLATKYKNDNESGTAFVTLVYGPGARGVNALAQEIMRAGRDAAVPPSQPAEYDAKDDPLGGLFDLPAAPAAEEIREIAV